MTVESKKEYIEIFITDGKARLAAMHQALAEADHAALERAAHTLKGSGLDIGAAQLAAVCEAVEGLGNAADLTGVPELLPQVEKELKRVNERLTTFLKEEYDNC